MTRLFNFVPLSFAAVALLVAGCGGGRPGGNTTVLDEPPTAAPVGYTEFVVKAEQVSAAFLDTHDFDGDGVQEIVLSTLIEQSPPGPPSAASRGALRIFRSDTGTLAGPWSETVVISTTDPEGFPFINTPQVMDIDGDGVEDILVQTGFLTTAGGAHFWQKCQLMSLVCNAAEDNMPRRYFSDANTRKETSEGFYWHESYQTDLDGDGMMDIVTTSTNSTNQGPLREGGLELFKVEWYRQTAIGTFSYHEIVRGTLGPDDDDGAGGVFIKMHDIDSDGDQDIVLSQFFGPPAQPSIVWMENVEAPSFANGYTGTWAKHTIDNTIGLGYHMEFVDIDGDNDIELVAGNHNHQDDPRSHDGEVDDTPERPPGLYIFEIPNNPAGVTQWQKRVIHDGFRVNLGGSTASQGVPGIFSVGDINNDGRLDVAVPGDGNDELYGVIQQPDGSWVVEIIKDGVKQFGMAIVTDIDGDGTNEIVAAQHNSIAGNESEHPTFPPGMLAIYKRTAP